MFFLRQKNCSVSSDGAPLPRPSPPQHQGPSQRDSRQQWPRSRSAGRSYRHGRSVSRQQAGAGSDPAALEKLASDPQRTILIGDTPHDREALVGRECPSLVCCAAGGRLTSSREREPRLSLRIRPTASPAPGSAPSRLQRLWVVTGDRSANVAARRLTGGQCFRDGPGACKTLRQERSPSLTRYGAFRCSIKNVPKGVEHDFKSSRRSDALRSLLRRARRRAARKPSARRVSQQSS